MERQQLLVTMILMGMNRIVVTDGKINVSVVFAPVNIDAIGSARSRVFSFGVNQLTGGTLIHGLGQKS
jgi:hypothetical protein